MSAVSKPFAEIFRRLVVATQPRNLEKDAVEVYAYALKSFSIEELQKSAEILALTKMFWPTVGEWSQVALTVRRDAARQLATAPKSTTIECDRCDDTGSVYADCPGNAFCGRPHPHAPHAFVCVCACRASNQTYQQRRAGDPVRGVTK